MVPHGMYLPAIEKNDERKGVAPPAGLIGQL